MAACSLVKQSASEPNTIWTERLAVNIGTPSLCNYFKFTGTTFVPNPTAGCTSYGVGGGRVNNPASNGGAAAPTSIVYQLQAGGAIAGTYKATDLLLMDGGGNDAADLVGAYLGATTPAGQLAYAQFLGTLLNAPASADQCDGSGQGRRPIHGRCGEPVCQCHHDQCIEPGRHPYRRS